MLAEETKGTCTVSPYCTRLFSRFNYLEHDHISRGLGIVSRDR
jgi:hypothetical protein